MYCVPPCSPSRWKWGQRRRGGERKRRERKEREGERRSWVADAGGKREMPRRKMKAKTDEGLLWHC